MPSHVPADIPETASWARRAGALLVDWFACMFVVIAFSGPSDYFTPGSSGTLYTTLLLVAEVTVFTALAGGSFGKLVTRLRVVRIGPEGTAPGIDPVRALLRAVLVVLVIPPLVFRPDGRGLHDMALGTATVPLSVLRG